MRMICEGFQKGLSFEQIEVVAKPEFSMWQMEEIISGFENGLSLEQVKVYAYVGITSGEMSDRKREMIREERTLENLIKNILK